MVHPATVIQTVLVHFPVPLTKAGYDSPLLAIPTQASVSAEEFQPENVHKNQGVLLGSAPGDVSMSGVPWV